jgi:hypothetical protein
MQTKKRARPVKFGKDVKKEEPKFEKEEKLEKTKPVTEEQEEVKESKAPSKKEALDDVEEESVEEPTEEVISEKEAEEAPAEEMSEEAEERKEQVQEEDEQIKKTSFGSFTKEDEQKGNGKRGGFGFFFLVAFLTFLIGLAVISGISYLMPDQKESLKVVNTDDANETPQPTAEPTTPPEEVDLTAYAVEVLNGSGTTGEAAKVKALLETAGFKVGTVGNADTSDYTKTVVSAKKSVNQQYLHKLMEELKKTYEVNTVVESATASQTSDVVVTIGSSTVE